MNLRIFMSIASLLALAAPLVVAAWSVLRFFALAPSPEAKDEMSYYIVAYAGAIIVGFVGFLLAGICLDGLEFRPRWYLRSLCLIGILWLFYFPAGTIFGAGLLFYLLIQCRSKQSNKHAAPT